MNRQDQEIIRGIIREELQRLFSGSADEMKPTKQVHDEMSEKARRFMEKKGGKQ